MRRRLVFLMLFVILVVAGWSVFWFYAAGEVQRRLDIAIDDIATRGTRIVCGDRTIGGFPFRMEVTCDKVDVMTAGAERVTAGAVRAVALIYNPRHIIIEADAPFSAQIMPIAATVSGNWSLAHSSLIFDKGAVSALAVSIENPDFALSGRFRDQTATAGKAELHVRRAPDQEGAADVAVTFDGLAAAGPFLRAQAFDAGALLRVPDAHDMLAGEVHPIALVGTPVRVEEAYVERGTAKISARGDLTVGRDGYLAGDLEITAVEPEKVAELVAPFYPPDSAIPAAFQGALTGFGRKAELDGRKAVSATLEFGGGGIRIGFIPIAQMVPLF